MPLTVLTPPAALPVSTAQIKQHLRIDHAEDDDYLTELAKAATSHCESHTRQHFVERTVRQYVDRPHGGNSIALEAFPVASVQAVTGYDVQGNAHLIAASEFSLSRGKDPVYLTLSPSIDASYFANGLEIDFKTGHGSSGIDQPSNLVRAVLVLTGHWYEHRGAQSADVQMGLIPPGLQSLLQPLRRVKL